MTAWKNKRIETLLKNSATSASPPALCMVATLTLTATRGAETSRENDAMVTAHPTQAKPLLLGNWADPTILNDGDDYSMTHSSFDFQPALLVWHSKDLRSGHMISHAAVNQPGSIWAPDLVRHDGKDYIYYGSNHHVALTADKDGSQRRHHRSFERFGPNDPLKTGGRRVALRIVNNKQVVSACYRDALGRWQALSEDMDASGANPNKLGGWGSVRPALFACGAGQARFYSFTYRRL